MPDTFSLCPADIFWFICCFQGFLKRIENPFSPPSLAGVGVRLPKPSLEQWWFFYLVMVYFAAWVYMDHAMFYLRKITFNCFMNIFGDSMCFQ